jgi:hypothetical protein
LLNASGTSVVFFKKRARAEKQQFSRARARESNT